MAAIETRMFQQQKKHSHTNLETNNDDNALCVIIPTYIGKIGKSHKNCAKKYVRFLSCVEILKLSQQIDHCVGK